MFPSDVTVVIPHIPIRPNALARAVKTAALQTHRPAAVSIAVDVDRQGAGHTRWRALEAARTTWVAFLDDDDLLLPQHLNALLTHAERTGADVVYPGCHVLDSEGQSIPLRPEWGNFGHDFDADLLREKSYIPITSLVRTEYAMRSLFTPPSGSHYEDWGFYLGMLDAGATFSHLAEITWVWNHNGRNTSGQPDKW